MIINIEGFTHEEEDFLQKAYKIRDAVFIQEQNVDKFLEYDGLDESATHFLLECNGIPVGTARYRETDEGIKLERFAVLKEYRGKAFASLILKMMLEEVLPSGKQIYLYAQASAVTFYENHKFKKVGNSFEEADIEHFKMIFEKS